MFFHFLLVTNFEWETDAKDLCCEKFEHIYRLPKGIKGTPQIEMCMLNIDECQMSITV